MKLNYSKQFLLLLVYIPIIQVRIPAKIAPIITAIDVSMFNALIMLTMASISRITHH